MSLMILVVGSALCNAAEFPIPAIIFYPSMVYAFVWDTCNI